jgi:CrcB protein
MSGSVLLLLAVAGAAGAVCRHLLVAAVQVVLADPPWAIAAVNLLGCFGFGLCWGIGVAAGRWSPAVSTAVLAGFFGAFTTFSSFAFDGHRLWSEQRLWLLLGNVLLQNVVGIAALAAGIVCAGWCSGHRGV